MVFITGANGLIGSYIARKFLEQGHQVKASIRPDSRLDLVEDIKHQITWVEGDVMDIPFLKEHTEGVDYVIHTAALVSFTPKHKEAMYQTNVQGTANIVNVCLQNQVKKLCFLSSVAALGIDRERTEMDESSHWQESDLNTHYALTKHLAELEVWRGHAEGLNMVILNPSLVLGPGDWHRSSTQIFKYVWQEKKYYTEGSLNYVDVRDVAEIAYQLCLSSIQSERFIVNAGHTTYQNFLNSVAECFSRKKPSRKLSPFLGGLAWRLARMQSLITGKSPFTTREVVLVARRKVSFQTDKLKKKLGFQYRDFSETIQWSCQELIKKYHLK